MRFHALGRLLTLAAVLALLVSCGEKETPEQRLERLRSRHEIYPAGVTTLHDDQGRPTLIIDVQVANQGTEPLSRLTVLVKVLGEDGATKASERATLDMEGVRPGIGERRTLAVPGVELGDTDEVFVELEANLTDDVLRQLPEYADVAGS
jgi:hypothetical protein